MRRGEGSSLAEKHLFDLFLEHRVEVLGRFVNLPLEKPNARRGFVLHHRNLDHGLPGLCDNKRLALHRLFDEAGEMVLAFVDVCGSYISNVLS